MTTALLQSLPRKASPISFILTSTIDEISSGKNSLVSPLNSTWIAGRSPSFWMTPNGKCFMSDWVDESENRRPMRRLASNTVFFGFIAAWFLAASPIMRSVSVNATNDGVVRLPWSLAMISTRSFCQMPTHEYVVPRSMPSAGPSTFASLPMASL